MSNSNKIPQGYRHTDVSNIPDGWGIEKLGNLIDHCSSGATPYRASASFYKGTVRWITSGELNYDVINDTKEKISDEAVKKTNLKVHPAGTFLMAITGLEAEGTRGACGIVGKPSTTNQSCMAVYTKDTLKRDYLFHYYVYKGNELAFKYCQGTKQQSYTAGIVKKLPVLIPKNTTEQSVIANALSDVDSLIYSLEKHIAKKRDIKLATMQQLLTGLKRLPSFTEKWLDTTLGKVIDGCSGGATPSRGRPEFYKGNIRWITSGELNYGRIYDTVEKITKLAVQCTNLKIIPAGTFLMAITGLEAEGTRGNCGIVGADSTTNQSCMAVFCSEKLLSDYLFYYYVLRGKSLAFQYCQGTKQQSYTAKLVKKLPILMPSDTKEQAAIVAILSDIDAEIEVLEKKLTKTKAIKRGMMQELLSGRIRLVKAEAQHKAKTKSASPEDKKHNWAIDEAVIISTLVHKFGSDSFPLGRKRYTKMSYLFHRYIDGKAEGYLKKAAGPYNPKTKYGGVETLARKNGYIQNHKNGKYSGFVEADKIEQALDYFKQWYGEESLQWLEQFRYEKNDTLELLATVDMAVQDLLAEGKEATVENIKDLIDGNKEWKAKLKREIFSDDNIAEAITRTRELLMGA